MKRNNLKKMLFSLSFVLLFVCCLCVKSLFGADNEALEIEKQEYEQDYKLIELYIKSLSNGQIPGQIIDINNFDIESWREALKQNDINSYEEFADEIQSRWSKKNKEYYAILMRAVCRPLSNGQFGDDRQHDLARKYALSGLAEPNEISLGTELELIGHVMTETITPMSPKGQEWIQRREQDVLIRLHAWKRLIDAIDPTWDPNEELLSPNLVGANMGLPSGISPEWVKDPKIRAEYKAALEENQKKIERYSEQNRLHKWLKRFPKRAEEYIIRAYSKPPFDNAELKQYLDKYITDTKTKTRILDAVELNIKNQTQNEPGTQPFEIAVASKEFKEQPGFREAQAKKIKNNSSYFMRLLAK